MSFDFQSRRFDPRWLLSAAEMNEEDIAEIVNAPPLLAREASSIMPNERVFDDALDQVALERRCVCPLCGAIVASDGTVVSARFTGPGDY